jgi:hypothetical protein
MTKLTKYKALNTVLVTDPQTGIEHRVFKGEAEMVKKKFAKRAEAAKKAKAASSKT